MWSSISRNLASRLSSERPRAAQRDVEDGFDPTRPRAHDGDAIGQIHRLVDLMSDEQDGLARFRPNLEELRLHELARLGVEGGERLVHQQDDRIGCERAGEVDALLHAAGKLCRENASRSR